MDQRAASLGLVHVGDRRLGAVLDVDQVERIFRDVTVVGHHERNRFADVAHAVVRERVLQVAIESIERCQPDRYRLRDRGDVGPGVDGNHAGQGECTRGIDAEDAGMRMRAAHHDGMQLARTLQVIDEGRAAGQEARILLARKRPADLRATRRCPVLPRRASRGAQAAVPSRRRRAAWRIASTIGT